MTDEGDLLESRLAAHFKHVRDGRRPGHVVFALEHGLDSAGIEEVVSFARSGALNGFDREARPLIWAVHATELAYNYDGEEYWPSFREATPEWIDTPWMRQEIRQVLQAFGATYGGPTPTGPWARQFSIITWPITNAVLPKDLQAQLAEALYRARNGLHSRLSDTEALGRYIAAAGGGSSDRYNQLRSQPQLLGQIALALLQREQTSEELLLPATLRRIAGDLEVERRAAQLLHEARRAADRPEVRPRGPRHGAPRAPSSVEERVRTAAAATGPQLRLKPARGPEGGWTSWLALPDLSPIAAIDPVISEALLTSRCWVPASDVPVARGRLLRSEQELPLARWPSPGSALIQFQGMAAGLEAALLSGWGAPSLPALFRVRVDGSADRVVSGSVRPGGRYLVVHALDLPAWSQAKVPISCDGVHLYSLVIPGNVNGRMALKLSELGVSVARTARVWPAGRVPVAWDGESAAEWLVDDEPMLGVSVDHDVQTLSVELDGVSIARNKLSAGSQVFVQLPSLEVGLHEVIIREVPTVGVAVARAFTVGVREPKATAAGGSGPIRVWVEPYSHDLAALWAGSIAVCIAGPSAEATVELALAKRRGWPSEPIFEESLRLPIGEAEWRALISSVAKDERAELRYDASGWGQVRVSAGRYGDYSLEFERPLPALRWRASDGNPRHLVLLDDTASAEDASVTFSPYRDPGRRIPVRVVSGMPDVNDPQGGLLTAKAGGIVSRALLPPQARLSWEEFRLDITTRPPVSVDEAATLVAEMAAWTAATLPGSPVARAWRARVIRRLHAEIVRWLCGGRWADAEEAFAQSGTEVAWRGLVQLLTSQSQTALRDAKHLAQLGEAMAQWPLERRVVDAATLARNASMEAPQTWGKVVSAVGLEPRTWAGELWLRLATDPQCFTWLGNSARVALEFIREWPLPLKAARCLALWTRVGTSDPPEFPPMVEGWFW